MEQLKKGYKNSEIGIIPSEWSTCRLRDLIENNRHIRYGVVQPGKFEVNGCLMLRSQDYSKGWSNAEKMHRVNFIIENQYKGTKLNSHDLVVTIVGAGIAQIVEIPNWLEGALLSRSTARISIDSNKANYKYIHHYLSSKQGRNQILFGVKEGAQPVVSANDVGNCLIPTPPTLTEQKAIADALTDVDELITDLEKLIAKKKAIKQGAMQQLLTPPHKGGKRLDGFSGDWVEVKLGDIVQLNKGEQLNKSTLESKGDYPVINGGIEPSGYTNEFNQIENTITISEGGNSCGFVNFQTSKFWSGGHCYTLQLKSDDTIKQFLFLFLKYNEKFIMSLRVGSGLPNIQKKRLNEFLCYYPIDKKEQNSIVLILIDIDKQIQKLESLLRKKIKLKQGMMQELLTGKTRLI